MVVKAKHKNRFSVKVLGEEIIVVGNVTDGYLKELVDYINNFGQEINRAYPCLPRQRLLGLALLNLADEYFKLKESKMEERENTDLLEQEIKHLKDKLGKLKREHEELLTLLEEVD